MRTRHVSLTVCVSLALALMQPASGAIHYVDKGNVGTEPYTNQATAAGDIQTAIDYASVGATIMVYAATYDVGGTVVPLEGLTNRVYINKAVSVRSVGNDPDNTIIKGFWDPATTNGYAAVRCVYMASGSSLIGFTITNGATYNAGGDGATGYRDRFAGGILCRSSSCVISNCTITGNAADGSPWASGGGGASSGTYYDCRFIGNRIGPRYSLGGGVFNGTLYNCLLTRNTAERGGGALRGTLYNCVVSNNIADKALSGAAFSRGGGIAGWNDTSLVYAYNCTIVSNRGDRGGGVGDFAVVSNCVIKLNKAPYTGSPGFGGGAFGPTTIMTDCLVERNTGGGVYRTYTTNCVIVRNTGYAALRPITLVNCLLADNTYGIYIDQTWYSLWRIDSCTVVGNNNYGLYVANGNVLSRNNIIYDNETQDWRHDAGTLTFSNTCTSIEQSGWDSSNITNSPRFVSLGSGYGPTRAGGDYHLSGVSPCLNVGLEQSWMADYIDLDGNPRLDVVFGAVDMGCYEHVFTGTSIMIR